MLFFFTVILLGCSSSLYSKAILRDDCDGDGSKIPNCKDHLTPELEGLSFYLPHENNCSRYWECSPNLLICLFECPPLSETELLYFNDKVPPQDGFCDWPSNVDCTLEGTTTTPAPPTTTTKTTAARTTTIPVITTKTTIAEPSTTTLVPTTKITTADQKTTTTTIAATTTAAPSTTVPTEEPTTSQTQMGSIEAITFTTLSCLGCPSGPVEGGLKVRLQSASGLVCETERGLDRFDMVDYVVGEELRFDQGVDDGLVGCYKQIFPEGIAGGAVTWTGSGIFAAKETQICVELSSDADVPQKWCCNMNNGYSQTNVEDKLEHCSLE